MEASKLEISIRLGKYCHYKTGNLYQVLGVALHTETLEEIVVYQALYESEFGYGKLWVRPRSMFFENVLRDGQMIPRFKFIEPSN